VSKLSKPTSKNKKVHLVSKYADEGNICCFHAKNSAFSKLWPRKWDGACAPFPPTTGSYALNFINAYTIKTFK
jgi:hypothetical protein